MQPNLKVKTPSVRIIPAIKLRNKPEESKIKRKTAAYARVSTDSDEQLISYEAQVDYYSRYIKSKEDWEFVKVYTDEGISATNIKKRDGFNEMIADALAGKIDLIVTKSVSRFARNTVDSLTAVRKLKEKGVEVFFEKEGIYTFDGKGELLITIMSSLAQEESRSISENVTWGQRKRMADGKFSLPYKHFLGYERGENGFPKIVESEAKIVRLIFKLFIEGKTFSAIAKYLSVNGIKSPAGKNIWQVATVRSILQNEKYKGDAVLQKKFTVDFLTKKRKQNEGEFPQYYVKNSHEAIIEPEEFDSVQAEIAKRKKLGIVLSCQNCFASKIVCEQCGEFYGSKVWGSNTKYRKIIWRCNNKYKGEEKCKTPHITEEDIKNQFLFVFNKFLNTKDEIIKNCRLLQKTVCDQSKLDEEILELNSEIEVVSELSQRIILQNARTEIRQEEFDERYESYLERHSKASERLIELESLKNEAQSKFRIFENFIKSIESRKQTIENFDEHLWNVIVEKVTVTRDGRLIFKFKDGSEIKKDEI